MVIDQATGAWIRQLGVYLGSQTNNEAEYNGALAAVMTAAKLRSTLSVDRVVFKGDSQLVVRQLNGMYQVRAENLKDVHAKVLSIARKAFAGRFEFQHVMREDNSVADRLANEAMDRQKSFERRRTLPNPTADARAADSPADPTPEASPTGVALALDSQDTELDSSALTATEINRLRVAQLKWELDRCGLPTDGRAQELRDRLRLHLNLRPARRASGAAKPP